MCKEKQSAHGCDREQAGLQATSLTPNPKFPSSEEREARSPPEMSCQRHARHASVWPWRAAAAGSHWPCRPLTYHTRAPPGAVLMAGCLPGRTVEVALCYLSRSWVGEPAAPLPAFSSGVQGAGAPGQLGVV